MVGVIWYRFVRCGGTDWSDTLVPIRPLQWYRLKRYVGTDSSATVVPIRRYYHHILGIDLGHSMFSSNNFLLYGLTNTYTAWF